MSIPSCINRLPADSVATDERLSLMTVDQWFALYIDTGLYFEQWTAMRAVVPGMLNSSGEDMSHVA